MFIPRQLLQKEIKRFGQLSAKVRKVEDYDRLDRPIYGEWKVIANKVHNLLTNAGKNYFHAQDYTNTSAGGVGANFIGLTEATITPAVGDTTLSSEISTNGLSRAIATTISHVADTNTTTLSKTFTASGSFTSVLASALFNASSSGTMAHIANFSSGSGSLATNDQLAVTWTMTLS